MKTMPTHVAGLPVAVNISCHVTRRARRKYCEVHDGIQNKRSRPAEEELSKLRAGDKRDCCPGTVYTARDAAHKRLMRVL